MNSASVRFHVGIDMRSYSSCVSPPEATSARIAASSASISASAPLRPSSWLAPPTTTISAAGRSSAARDSRKTRQSAADCSRKASRTSPWIGMGMREIQCTAIADHASVRDSGGKIRP